MQIAFELLPDNDRANCERCKSNEWPRIALRVSDKIRFILCAFCLAYAIDCASGWNTRAMLRRWMEISPIFREKPLGVHTKKPNMAEVHWRTHKETRVPEKGLTP